MKCWQKNIVGFAIGLALPAMAATNDSTVSDHAYVAIAARNIFGLKPLTTLIAPTNDLPVVTEPKITLNGITSVLGPEEVLFKVTLPDQPGHSGGENSYLLGAGQSQDEIEVCRIDLEKSTVTFNNHGVIQEIVLAQAPKLPFPMLTANPAPTVTMMDPSRAAFERSRMPEYLGGSSAGQGGAPLSNQTLDQRILLIEAQRQYYKEQNDPRANDLPATAMTPQE